MLLCYTVLLTVAKYSVPIEFFASRDYAKFALVGVVAGVTAMRLMPLALGVSLLAWAGGVGLFLLLARYRFAECGELARCFLPGHSSLFESTYQE